MSAMTRTPRHPRFRARIVAAVGVSLAAALALSACAGSSSGTAPTATATDGPISYEDFTFTSWNYGEDAQKALIEQEVAGFTDGKDITADLVSFTFTSTATSCCCVRATARPRAPLSSTSPTSSRSSVLACCRTSRRTPRRPTTRMPR